MLLLLASAAAGSAAAGSTFAATSPSSAAVARTVAPTPLYSVVYRPCLAEGVGPCAPVALVILLDGGCLLDVLLRPLCRRQQRHRSLDVVKELALRPPMRTMMFSHSNA